LALALLCAVPAGAQDKAGPAGPIPTSAFAAKSPFSGMLVLSPDGLRVAVSLMQAGQASVAVVGLDNGRIERRVAVPDAAELEHVSWAGNHYLLVSTSLPGPAAGPGLRAERTHAIDLDTGAVKDVAFGFDQVVYVDPAGEYLLASTRNARDRETEVDKVWLSGERPDERLLGQRNVLRWLADNSGAVRVGLAVKDRKVQVWYREGAGQTFRLVATLGRDDQDRLWDVTRLVTGSDEGYTIAPGPSGRQALRRFNLVTHEPGEVVYENPRWDVTDAEIDEHGKPLWVSFTDDSERTVWLDPDIARLQARLERALGGAEVTIINRSQDGSRLLLTAASASDPGAFYLYDAKTRQLKQFAKVRPQLDAAALSPVRAVEYTARDGTKIGAYLALPRGRDPRSLPLVVLPHGGPYGIRDTLEYSDEVQVLASRGYAVLQPNFRGSGGFGEDFEQLGKGQIGRQMQDDIDDAVDWAAAQGLVDPTRVCLVGSSYGGYAALWGVERNPERYRCAASFAGVTDWDSQLRYDDSYFDRAGNRAWREQIRGEDRKFDLASVSPARRAAQITRPVLLAHGRRDTNVPFDQFERMRTAMTRAHAPGAEYLVLDDTGHGFATEQDEQAWYDALLAFLAKNNPA
jgi:dipeptidyl aminopeptidase/acylaminoacyl peptidase